MEEPISPDNCSDQTKKRVIKQVTKLELKNTQSKLVFKKQEELANVEAKPASQESPKEALEEEKGSPLDTGAIQAEGALTKDEAMLPKKRGRKPKDRSAVEVSRSEELPEKVRFELNDLPLYCGKIGKGVERPQRRVRCHIGRPFK